LKIQVIAEPSESDRICKPSPYALKYIPLSSRTDAVEHKIGQSDPVEIRLECDLSHESTQIQWWIASAKVVSGTKVAHTDRPPVAHDTYPQPEIS